MIKQNKFVNFFRRYGLYIFAGILVVGIGVSFGVMFGLNEISDNTVDVLKPNEEDDSNQSQNTEPETPKEDNSERENNNNELEPVSNPEVITFQSPMTSASVIQDYSDTNLQYNPTLDRWEAHFYVDLTSDDLMVYSVLDGKVLSVDYDYLTGYVVKVEHNDGFESVYSSLDENISVKSGDEIKKGSLIGKASNSAASSSSYGDHLEFTLLKEGKKVDPNNYLDLQNK